MSKLNDIMVNAKAALVAATVGSDPAFVSVVRGKISGQSYQTINTPAAGIWRLKNLPAKRGCTELLTAYDLILMVEVRGSSGTADEQDANLIDLRNAVNTALANNTLGGKCAALDPVGDDPSVDMATPAGYEQIAFKTVYTESKVAVH